jgi:hypothetical protein
MLQERLITYLFCDGCPQMPLAYMLYVSLSLQVQRGRHWGILDKLSISWCGNTYFNLQSLKYDISDTKIGEYDVSDTKIGRE